MIMHPVRHQLIIKLSNLFTGDYKLRDEIFLQIDTVTEDFLLWYYFYNR